MTTWITHYQVSGDGAIRYTVCCKGGKFDKLWLSSCWAVPAWKDTSSVLPKHIFTWAPQGNPTPGLCLLCPHIPTHWITVLTSFPSENNHTGAHILRGLKSLKLHVQPVSISQEVNVNRTKRAKMDKINEGSQLPKPSFKCTHLLEVFQTLRVDWMTFLGTPKLIQIRVTQSSRTVRTTRKTMQESKL